MISFCGFLLFDRRLISHLFDKLDILAGGDHGVCVTVSGVTMSDATIGGYFVTDGLQSLELQPKLRIFCYTSSSDCRSSCELCISCVSIVPFIF